MKLVVELDFDAMAIGGIGGEVRPDLGAAHVHLDHKVAVHRGIDDLEFTVDDLDTQGADTVNAVGVRDALDIALGSSGGVVIIAGVIGLIVV
jgi:hypothetical protein